jgi:hypothetical protein
MTADRRGTFHPLWADARSGTFQLYTATIRVDQPPPPPTTDPEEAKYQASRAQPKEPLRDPASRVQRPLQGQVEFVFDPTVHDAAKGTVEFPLRLRNISGKSIYAPITLEIVRLGSGFEAEPPKNPPQLLNADNGLPGVGARFAFDAALGGDGELKPGMLSGPVPLRFRVPLGEPLDAPSLQFKVSGSMEGGS